MGKTIQAERSRFLDDNGYKTISDYISNCIENGKVNWTVDIGLATLDEQIAGLEELSQWCKQNDFNMHMPLCVPCFNIAIPKELRDNAAGSTGYMLEDLEDYKRHEQIEGINCCQVNQVLYVPNALETTINCIKTGTYSIGTASQLAWNFEGCNDHVKYVTDTLRALGIMASKRKEGFATGSYPEDGIGGYCLDCVSFVGILLFEHYIYEKLCGVNHRGSFGGLVSDIRTKAALAKAMYDSCKESDHGGLGLMHATTTFQWDHDVLSNFGPSMQEILMLILTERHYKTGTAIMPIPVTEALNVPTLRGIKDILGAAARMETYAYQWDDLIDWNKIDHMAADMLDKGTKMFNNILKSLEEAGLDTEDPLQMMMVIKNINGALFEEAFHPSVRETGKFTPYYPNDMGGLVEEAMNSTLEDLNAKGYGKDALKGKKVITASLDGHINGMRYVIKVLSALGAEVVMGGVDNTPQSVLDMAEEEGIKFIGVSTHNGQALGFADQLEKLMKQRNKEFFVFMGGVLNSILPGHSEPTDVTEMIVKKGIFASNDLEEAIKIIQKN